MSLTGLKLVKEIGSKRDRMLSCHKYDKYVHIMRTITPIFLSGSPFN